MLAIYSMLSCMYICICAVEKFETVHYKGYFLQNIFFDN